MLDKVLVYALLAVIAMGVWFHQPNRYVVERVKDVNGNDAFLRVDVQCGEKCTIGRRFAVTRQGPANSYLVPSCVDQK